MAFALISLAPAHAGTAGDRSFLVPYSCEGALVAEIPADASTVREVGAIPRNYELLGEASGTTALFFWHLLCDFRLDEKYYKGVSLSGLSVELQSPPAVCPGCPRGVYDVWQVTDSPKGHALFTRAGLYAPLVPGTSVSFEHVGGNAVAGKVTVPWTGSAYEIRAAIQGPTAPLFRGLDGCGAFVSEDGCVPTDHWYEGTHGTYLQANANCDLSIAGAHMKISAEPGSPLALILGAAQLEVSGAFVRVGRATGRGDLAKRFATGEAARPPCPEHWPE